ncbi:hypothetical protein VPH35_086522 [Triticum aestivum]
MAGPRPPTQATAILLALATWCLVFLRSSSAPAVPALRPPPPPSAPGGTLCIPRERDALLTFKAGLTNPSNHLSSWRADKDCCRWMGVGCSNQIGHVIKLDLNSYNYGPLMYGSIGGEINPSLLTLQHLQYLDLSFNDFDLTRSIPEFIGGLRSLIHLALTDLFFGGRIPPHLGNLSNLVSLDLSIFGCYSPDLVWVRHLQKLQYLYMDGVDLSAVVNWTHAVNMLPSLLVLTLAGCGLRNIMPPPLHSNLTSLKVLCLESNPFNSSLGANHLVWDLPMLRYLRMYDCRIQGPIPAAVGNMTSIEYMILEGNNFLGMVPSTFKKLKRLKVLTLSENSISGSTEDLFHRLPAYALQELYLDHNNLTGGLPNRLEDFSSLTTLWLNNNELSEEIHVGIRKLTKLKELLVNSNNLHGTLTEHHFTNLSSLRVLWISDNSLSMLVNNTWNGPFKLTSGGFRSCILGPQFPVGVVRSTINTLDLSNTGIHDSIPVEFWTATRHARALDLSGNQIVGRLPANFRFGGKILNFCYVPQQEPVMLDISSNQLVGPIPELSKNLIYLDLSRNNLSGSLPSNIGAPKLEILVLFKNSFSGTIPCSMFELRHLWFLDISENLLNGSFLNCPRVPKTSSITVLNLNSNNLSRGFPSSFQMCKGLQFLDIANNKFSGSLPTWIESKLPYLQFLRLRSNMFSGRIPVELTMLKHLQYLDIASNNLSGNIPWNIPPSLGNLFGMVQTPNQQDLLFYTLHAGLSAIDKYSYAYNDSLSVVTKGQQLEFTTGIAYMVNMDFSCNSLTGEIPHEIGMLIALKSLNLSWNDLSSTIPLAIGELRAVESLDLSHNELSGEIPTSLAGLTSLAHLNLSYNNLTGTIPSGNQLQALDDQASIYIGNPGLCGPLVSRSCSGMEITQWIPEDQHEGMSDALSLYLGICTGFIAGLWIIFCGFLFKRNWRIIWFSFFDCMCDWVYVRAAVSWASFTRME